MNESRASLMRAWLAYAGVGLVVVALAAGGATLLLEAEAARAVQVAAGIAYVLQLAAFAALLAVRGNLFLAGWLGGMVLRFGGLGAVAWWLTATRALPRAAALISLAGFLFVLLLLEPIFLRRGIRTT